ncbi:MAG TPA: 2-amino-4-oxopentanoate thiolase subunit OrtA [Selenomonadales bacterium]|nr:2-amino-4-oxopentanoate thiolase subunit OrtA [Selenomonadales bacterium]
MSNSAKKGDWVQIHQIVLTPGERTGKIPEETKKVPLELWVKGFIQSDAAVGDTVEVVTVTGRAVSGSLAAVNPAYAYGFGDEYVPELLRIGSQARSILEEGGEQ